MRLDKIKKFVVTEKSVQLFENQQYVFDVDPSLSKPQIKALIESHFKVRVSGVNTHRLPSKRSKGRTRSTKRAIVTLAPGSTLPVLDQLGSTNSTDS
uniref:Large ribosomal subunit protein uL23c n=1 Tax=Chloroparvula japonica TaxID=1411623 RepID=A0A4D6C525_9CHLO|nr:ribosomal protein L23 [Chloroparvula japonica]QBX98139.1 ribosomal protein L23 [Chloroparvula japonica]